MKRVTNLPFRTMKHLVLRFAIVMLILGVTTVFAIGQSDSRINLNTVVAAGFAAPLQVTHAGDGSMRLFVVEQGGIIRVVEEGVVLPTPFLDLSDRTAMEGERGLLGLAFHPNFKENQFFYVNYTNPLGDTIIARFSASVAEPRIAVPETGVTLLQVPQPFSNHNGGMLAFSPVDNFLYIGLGDGGSGNDPLNHGQNRSTLLGTLLRIDVNNGFPYGVPENNPFVGQDGADEIWSIGLRNPWRFSFDRETGDLYIGDVGQDNWEEIDFQAVQTPGGLNFGWAVREGPCPTGITQPCATADPSLTEPIVSYSRGVGQSVTGGFVYRGTRFPALLGRYFYGDFLSGRIWSLSPVNPDTLREVRIELDSGLAISSFGEDELGELYVVDYFGGTVRRLEDSINAPAFLLTSMPEGFVGVPYFHKVPVRAGMTPHQYELVSGRLAPGLTGPKPSTGVVSGTPTQVGTFGPFTVRVTDARGVTSERQLTHTILSSPDGHHADGESR